MPAPGPGDRIVVVGAGVVGLLVASLAARLPGAEVTAVDVDESREPIVEALGARFARARAAPRAMPTSSSTPAPAPAGLDTAIDCAGLEGTIVEMSWYGDKPVSVDLGGAFHSRRLKLVSSQVGQVSAEPPPALGLSPPRRGCRALLAHAGARCAGRRGDRLRGCAARAAAHPWRRARTVSPRSSAIPQA